MTPDEYDIEILRRMTPEQKLAVMRSLIRQAYALRRRECARSIQHFPRTKSRPVRLRRWAVTDPDLLRLFVAPLQHAGITYMVTGGWPRWSTATPASPETWASSWRWNPDP